MLKTPYLIDNIMLESNKLDEIKSFLYKIFE